MTLQETASFSEFAVVGGFRKSWVTQLRHDGRLVLTEDGKRVRVAESFARIKETEDPSRDGVRARHAATRAGEAGDGAGASQASAEGEGECEEPLADASAAQRRARALARSAELDMRKKERDEQVELRELLRADDVERELSAATATLRTAFENLPDTLAPELAAVRDEGRVRVLLAEGIDRVLDDAARTFANIARGVEER